MEMLDRLSTVATIFLYVEFFALAILAGIYSEEKDAHRETKNWKRALQIGVPLYLMLVIYRITAYVVWGL